jgi:putative ABC transport system permease protein
VLVANVAMSIRVARAAQEAQFEVDPSPLLVASLTLPNDAYGTAHARTRFLDRLEETISALPPVASFAVTSALPGAGGPQRRVSIAGRPSADASAPTAVTVFVGNAYFQTVGAPLVSGRPFAPTDGTPGQDTAIVNERFARVFLGDEDPIGTLIRISESDSQREDGPWRRIIGVAPSIRQSGGGGIEPDPVVYLPVKSAPPSTVAIMVRTAGDPVALIPSVREAVRQIDPSLPLYRTMTLEEAMWQQQWNGRISRVLLTGIGVIALLLASVGLYAVTAHAVRLRRKELGIRMALGARRQDVSTLVLGGAMRQIATGLVVGVGATVAFDRLFNTSTTGVRLTDALVLLPALLGIVVVGAAACLWPASSAATLDPAAVLHDE